MILKMEKTKKAVFRPLSQRTGVLCLPNLTTIRLVKTKKRAKTYKMIENPTNNGLFTTNGKTTLNFTIELTQRQVDSIKKSGLSTAFPENRHSLLT